MTDQEAVSVAKVIKGWEKTLARLFEMSNDLAVARMENYRLKKEIAEMKENLSPKRLEDKTQIMVIV